MRASTINPLSRNNSRSAGGEWSRDEAKEDKATVAQLNLFNV